MVNERGHMQQDAQKQIIPSYDLTFHVKKKKEPVFENFHTPKKYKIYI